MIHERLLRLPEVSSQTGLKRAAIYAAIQRGLFPSPVKIGRRAVAWPQSDIDKWIADRIAEAAAERAAAG